ncbi:MAG: aspartate/glutamate racemase family protein [Candidatus Gracilibacteria bacterium]|jgi:glutamate racemase
MIGVFDSGFGGLSILKAFLSTLPEESYVYFGDSARAPYGNHSPEKILEFTREGVNFLFSRGCSLVILACNTASANALRALQEEMIRGPREAGSSRNGSAVAKDRNILGVVVPIAEAVSARAGAGGASVGIIGTRATVESNVYEIEIKRRAGGAAVFQKACPLLVPLIEEGYAFKMETKRILKGYLREMKSRNLDVLVPACTHYPILQGAIQRIMGKRVCVLDTGKIVAESLKKYLEKHPEMSSARAQGGRARAQGTREFFTSGDPERFSEMGSVFLGKKFKAEKV